MVARTKISPSLVIEEGGRRNLSCPPRNINIAQPNGFSRKDSFSECSALSRRSESFDGSLSSSLPIPVAPAPSAANVRSRFLNRLGFLPPMQQSMKKSPSKRGRSGSRDSSEPSFQVLLKEGNESRSSLRRPFNFFSQGSSTSFTSSESDFSLGDSERSVSFSPSVTVHPIPKHSAYSQRIRQTIWTAPSEMQENAARNCIEFAAENWDWRQVAEDQDMVLYQGELVHPVHFAHEYNIRRQFCAVMSAQSQNAL
uniref:Uncharacterized protein n=1 Tax=Amphora coffeiformis TaxID=265554 RepID=A0A7S3LF57_9STRA|mmetsp:Transcript_11140/g.21199  ORF Transcript_11140/g.21199 Transcript_11140/m.21199 type:complete len:254 (+) Transcript_11140:199-960(+)